jgi:hypothetical protein
MSRLFRVRSFGIVLLILVLAAAIYGFAAANTVPESGAGDGEGTISGYTISDIQYTLNGTDPGNIDSVEFDIAATGGASAPTTVTIEFNSSGSWYSCTVASGHATCDTTSPAQDVLSATSLRVVAAQ